MDENLQVETGNPTVVTGDNSIGEQTNTETKQEKTFTQEELNEIVKSRLDRERKKYPTAEELKGYAEWKKSQQTEIEKYEELNKNYQTLKSEYNTLKNYNLVQKENVNEMFAEFVIDKVSKQEGNFEDNLTKFKKENPQFFIQGTVIKTATSPNLENTKQLEPKRKGLKQYF